MHRKRPTRPMRFGRKSRSPARTASVGRRCGWRQSRCTPCGTWPSRGAPEMLPSNTRRHPWGWVRGRSMLGFRTLALVVVLLLVLVSPLTLDPRPSCLVPRPSTLDPRASTSSLSSSTSTLAPRASTSSLSSSTSTLVPRTSTLDPRPSTSSLSSLRRPCPRASTSTLALGLCLLACRTGSQTRASSPRRSGVMRTMPSSSWTPRSSTTAWRGVEARMGIRGRRPTLLCIT